ncbi:MAG: AbrB/MazE/SpoVT family DNA-binding domain-containing protein [Rivularia sp. T60_A2020_040]|nr:AbrB/MazE/SpoVT family DNA-binding domain-containing protein [Rivularia sp. T60_A2020_040]
MTNTSENINLETKTFPVRLEKEGVISIPQAMQDNLSLSEGDMLTFVQIGDLVLLTLKKLQVPQLADKIAALRQDAGLSIEDLLEGLEQEREAIWLEQQKDA